MLYFNNLQKTNQIYLKNEFIYKIGAILLLVFLINIYS